MALLAESDVEEAALEWFAQLGYEVLYGPDIAPNEPASERADYRQVVLVERLRQAAARLNPAVPAEAREEAVRTVLRAEEPTLIGENRRFHTLLAEGVPVEYQAPDGRTVHDVVWLLDFNDPARNDWLVVNQFTVIEHKQRRPDLVVFVNGLPLGVVELKNPNVEHATSKTAFNQLQTYKTDIPTLFHFNEVLVVSDGYEARAGTLTADWERFMPWRTVDGSEIAPKDAVALEVLIKGIFEHRRLLDLIQHFIVFEVDGPTVSKKLAAYHQYHAVNKAVARTVAAAAPSGDRRVGVVWHTQGSGKSLSMVFYAGKIIRHPAMANPTLVVLTDRNDLDDQLFGTFAGCRSLLRQTPVQSESRAHLRELLRVASGGVVFTTIQKFLPAQQGERYPLLSERRNIVVIADEAHRSQYDFIDGFARHLRDALPHASFIGFTGTPIEAGDRSTPAVFGDYIDVYDIQRAVEDGATVRIYYEGRLAKLGLSSTERGWIDEEFDEVTEGAELAAKEKLKTKWARLEAMVGAEERVKLIAKDIVAHVERREAAIEGKAMIVCMSRRICVDLYHAIVALRPDWHSDDDQTGTLKVVMTGSAADPQAWQPHIRSKAGRTAMANRFKDPDDPLKLVIVRDMWLTGFDVPPLHTMYIDKPMRGHGLMQAIARVNRVFKDKPGGLVVDYIGIADQLKRALMAYTEGDRGQTGIPQEQAAALLVEKVEVARALFHGFDYRPFLHGTAAERVAIIPPAMEHILAQPDGKSRFVDAVNAASKAFALAVPHEDALALRDDLAFFQTVRNRLQWTDSSGERTDPEAIESAIRQIVSQAVAADEVVDIYAAAGLKNPDISILSDAFLEEVRHLPYRNVALELLKKLLNDEIKAVARSNVVQARSFAALLEQSIRQYTNRTIESAEVIQALIELAKQVRAARQRGEELGLSAEELAFYDALGASDSAVSVLGDAELRDIARELVESVRGNASIDWTLKESSRAKLRTIVKRILRRHHFPPDQQEQATITVLQQAELFADQWAA